MSTVNLGLVKAIHSGVLPPVNTQMLWYDTSVFLHKYYNTNTFTWDLLKDPGDHNSLTNIQGGNGVDEFYHLTAAQFSSFVSGSGTVDRLAMWINTNEVGDSDIYYDSAIGNFAIKSAVQPDTKLYILNEDAIYGFRIANGTSVIGSLSSAIVGSNLSNTLSSIGVLGTAKSATSQSSGVVGAAGNGLFSSISYSGEAFGVQGYAFADVGKVGVGLASHIEGSGSGVGLWINLAGTLSSAYVMRLENGTDNTGKYLKVIDANGHIEFSDVTGTVDGTGVANNFTIWQDSDTITDWSGMRVVDGNRVVLSDTVDNGLIDSWINIVSNNFVWELALGAAATASQGALYATKEFYTGVNNNYAGYFVAGGTSVVGGNQNYGIFSKSIIASAGNNVAGYFEAHNAGVGSSSILQLVNGQTNTNKYLRIKDIDGHTDFAGIIQDDSTKIGINTAPISNHLVKAYTDTLRYGILSQNENADLSAGLIGIAYNGSLGSAGVIGIYGTGYTLPPFSAGGYFQSDAGLLESIAIVGEATSMNNSYANIGLYLRVANSGTGGFHFMRVSDGSTDYTGKTFRIIDSDGNVDIVDWLGGDVLGGIETSYYIPRWSSTAKTIENSLIRTNDINSVASIGDVPDTSKLLHLKTHSATITTGLSSVADGITTAPVTYGAAVKAYNSRSAIGVYGIAGDLVFVTGGGYFGGYFEAKADAASNAYGIYAKSVASSVEKNVAGYFEASNAGVGDHYALQIKDGSQQANKVLTCIDNDGHAIWQELAAGGNVIADTESENYLTKWTAASHTITKSQIQDDGMLISIGGDLESSKFVKILSLGTSKYALSVSQRAVIGDSVGSLISVLGGTLTNTGIAVGAGIDPNNLSSTSIGGSFWVKDEDNDAVALYADSTNNSTGNNVGLYVKVKNDGLGDAYVLRLQDSVDNTGKILKINDVLGNAVFTTVASEIIDDLNILSDKTWSSFKIDQLTADFVTKSALQSDLYTWAKDTGNENTIYVTLSPRPAPEEMGVLPDGMKIGVRAKYGNTISDPHLGMNCRTGGLDYSTLHPIVKWGNQPLSPGDYTENMECLFRFNADIQKWELMNPKGSSNAGDGVGGKIYLYYNY